MVIFLPVLSISIFRLIVLGFSLIEGSVKSSMEIPRSNCLVYNLKPYFSVEGIRKPMYGLSDAKTCPWRLTIIKIKKEKADVVKCFDVNSVLV